ncbi:hypothetical protein ATANTOWER_029570 [Ataeniobius toweri]|uniref:Uncharacterized protein n=1 Tax=Ataeniobius toweri TaxID=208326 RepID=A0ABU7ARM3_9TELE|nr:hypothetical protein [Ataeniobius toweri]
MMKITGFKLKDDQTDGGLDRANELNTFFNRFGLKQAQHPPLLLTARHPTLLSPTAFLSHLKCFIFYLNPSASTGLPSTKSEDADASFSVPSSTSVSQKVR